MSYGEKGSGEIPRGSGKVYACLDRIRFSNELRVLIVPDT
jgi:hypothetical protein